MSPSSTVHGGQYDTINKYVTFELPLHAAFMADKIWGDNPEPARTRCRVYEVTYFRFFFALFVKNRGICINTRYHSEPKYKYRLYINIESKRSLHSGTECALITTMAPPNTNMRQR